MENMVGSRGPAPDDYWEQEVTMTRAQLQGERDAWYENGLTNGRLREMGKWRTIIGDVLHGRRR